MSYDIAFQATALPRVREAIVAALTSTFSGRVYWQVAPHDAEYPLCVFHSQDRGGKRSDYIGENGWTGLVTFRVMSDDPDEADDTLASVPALLQGQSVDGYALTVVPDRPIDYPPESTADGDVFTAAFIAAINIS